MLRPHDERAQQRARPAQLDTNQCRRRSSGTAEEEMLHVRIGQVRRRQIGRVEQCSDCSFGRLRCDRCRAHSCAQFALIRNFTGPRRALAVCPRDSTNRAGLPKYSCARTAHVELVCRTTRGVHFLRAQRALLRAFSCSKPASGTRNPNHGGAKNEVSSTPAHIFPICAARTWLTARAADCERRLLGDVECDRCLHRRHDRQLERHRISSELVDTGRQPRDPQRRTR